MSNTPIGDQSASPFSIALATLISRELRGNWNEKPFVRFDHAGLAKRGEDCFLIKPECHRIPENPSTSFSVFAIFDGHNGVSAAIFTKEHLLEHILGAIPSGIGREEWLNALPRAMVAGFVKTDMEFQRKGEASGTTATFVVIDGLIVTVASVGDSRCILDSKGGSISLLTVDHRLEENEEERKRITASGGEVGRLNLCGGQELPESGARLILASDGIWDALPSEMAAMCCRGLPTKLAARQIVKEALRTSGLKDDTTCLVVDIIPSDNCTLPASPRKQQNKFKSLFSRRPLNFFCKLANKSSSIEAIQELFEEGSAVLEERLNTNAFSKTRPLPYKCAVCQTNQIPNERKALLLNALEGPYFCTDCRRKMEAMEGKKPSCSAASI